MYWGTKVSGDPVDMYRRMALIRAFETKIHELLTTGAIHGTSHLCAGQEAVAVGACAALGDDDMVMSTHRGHGHFIARGGDPRRIMAELWGKVDGYSRGRGGSQHMACKGEGFLGSNGITGGGIPVATGAALAMKMRGSDSLVLCMLGDGATNQGTFHESLNMAALWRLPVIYLCENNLYAMSTPVRESTAIERIADRAAAYGMTGATVDGNDVTAVRDSVASQVTRIRAGGGPALLECTTYRICGHSRSDRCDYRPAEEEASWRERDPLLLCERELVRRGVLDKAGIEQARAGADDVVRGAVAFAENAALPDPAELEGAAYA